MMLWLMAAACTVILTRATIFRWLQRGPEAWRSFMHCPLCVGWWVGAFFAASELPGRGFGWRQATLFVIGGGAVSGCLALLYVVIWERLTE